MRSDADRLEDILEAIVKIEERTKTTEEVFVRDEMLQVWVVHHLQIIGEAARGLSQNLREQHPEVAWAELVALRNILVHEYFGLNMKQVWMMIRKELPVMKAQVERIG